MPTAFPFIILTGDDDLPDSIFEISTIRTIFPISLKGPRVEALSRGLTHVMTLQGPSSTKEILLAPEDLKKIIDQLKAFWDVNHITLSTT